MTEQKQFRSLSTIGAEIRSEWPNMSAYAKPYVTAMRCLHLITDKYGSDDARSVVLYFLSNANTWRGETAKRVKAELKEMIRSTGYRI